MKARTVKILVKEPNVNFLQWYTLAEGFHHPIFKKYVGKILPNWLIYIKDDFGQWGVPEDEWLEAGESFARRFQAGKIDIKDIEQIHYACRKKIFKTVAYVYSGELINTPSSRLFSTLKSLWQTYYLLNGAGYVPVISDLGHGFLLNQARQILINKNVPANKVQASLSLLIRPNRKTLFWQEQLELAKLCRKYQSLPKLYASADFKNHVKKWFWLNYGYQGPVWEKKDFTARSRQLFNMPNLRRFIRDQEKEFPLLVKKQKLLTKKLGLSKSEDYYFKTARLFTFLKGYRIEVRHRYCWAMDAIFAELSRRFSVPMTFFRYATTKEIMALKSGAVDVAAVVKRRKKMLYLCENKKGRFIPFTKIERTFNDLLAVEKVGNLNQVSGTTAYPGKVSGRVRILRDKMDVKKLKAGEVLVTFGTTPDFLPAMIKASAYVTEQGGVTSHAAIVAREMKKPCVIGTRIATKVFRDGELVEVDANRGIVRKIK